MPFIEAATAWNMVNPRYFLIFSIKIYNSKILYPYKHNNLTCFVYDNLFKQQRVWLKSKIVVGMWKLKIKIL